VAFTPVLYEETEEKQSGFTPVLFDSAEKEPFVPVPYEEPKSTQPFVPVPYEEPPVVKEGGLVEKFAKGVYGLSAPGLIQKAYGDEKTQTALKSVTDTVANLAGEAWMTGPPKTTVQPDGTILEDTSSNLKTIERAGKIRAGISGLAPKAWGEAQESIRQQMGEGHANWFEQGSMALADNAGNLLGSTVNPFLGLSAMYANEANGMRDQLTAMGLEPELVEKYSAIYGSSSAPIEYIQLALAKGAAGLTKKQILEKGLGATVKKRVGKALGAMLAGMGINVGEELTQQGIENAVYNKAMEEHNSTTGENRPYRQIFEAEQMKITAKNAASMSAVLDILGLPMRARSIKARMNYDATAKQLVDDYGLTAEDALGVVEKLATAKTQEEQTAILEQVSTEYTDLTTEEQITESETKEGKDATDTIERSEETKAEQEAKAENGEAKEALPRKAEEVAPVVVDETIPAATVEAKKVEGESQPVSAEKVPQKDATEAVEPSIKADGIVGASKEDDNFMREELGLDKTEDPAVRSQRSVVLESRSAKRDPNVLLDEIESKPRAIQDHEVADILLEKVSLRKQLKVAIRKRNKAEENSDEYNRYQAQIDGLAQRTARLTEVSRLAKTETGRGLAAMAMRMDETSYELVDVLERATNTAKRKLTDQEIKDITKDADAVNAILEGVEDADTQLDSDEISEKQNEILENIEQAKRTIKKQGQSKKRTDEKLSRLKEIERDQDKIFTLIDELNRMETKIGDEKIYEDPEGYKETIRRLLDYRKNSAWYHELKASKTRDSRRKIAILDDLLDDLQAQYVGKYRNIKEKQITDPDDVASMKAKIRIIRDAMRIQDSLSAVNEDLRLISKGRLDELSITKKRERGEKKFDVLEKKRNELNRAKEKLNRRISELQRSGGWDTVLKVADFKRAIRLSLDSWIGRQGSKVLFSDPKLALTAWGRSVPAFISKDYFYSRDRLMKETESYKKSVELMGVEYNDIDGTFEVHQEAMNSRLAENIPLVAGSNRHMIMGINELRHHLSKKFLNRFPNESKEFYEAAGTWINELTGRGTLGGLERSAHTLTSLLTAPRWMMSNWQFLFNERHALLKDKDGKKAINWKLAKEIESQKARMLMGFGLVAGSLIALGYEPELDPEDSDFMKLRKGNHVVNLMPGLSSNAKLLALGMESFASRIGIGELEKSGDVRKQFKNYMFYKLVPIIGEAFEIMTGETAIGEERTLLETLTLNNLPIMIESIYQDGFKDDEELDDVIKSTTIEWFGTGSALYEDRNNSSSRRQRRSRR